MTFSAKPAHISHAEWQTRVDLAACYRLCALQSWDDVIYTHISAAVPDEPGHFLLNPFGLRFDEICASNLVKIDQHGKIVGTSAYRINVSGFAIHGAVHAVRPDANCVMHLHNDHAVAVSAQPQGLLPLSQHALRFYEQIACHDYEGLALTPGEQTRLIERLGDYPALLLRNHGSLICGRTIAEAYVLMDTLDKACRIQLLAQAGGQPLQTPAADVCRKTHQQLLGDGSPEGLLEWPALLRKLDALDASYKN
ncbi:ribulose-5-phosphate 4-epimerase-like epimerase or aldolase [Herbaspirillum sp. CF444]|uniref:class II aldolase/adducin family protein n=1 Tax=Herbaspirillum sp. CF444 TaxID=1144319 RepID=UPI00027273DA|nr:class II aldolase/adducin family protein [Herbaspirillum sp. CF444]EJL87899.1 ribulose-5-phosphate 4-epimerase-like epimerase or aldolase [Herbaspirillum sp. CF444]